MKRIVLILSCSAALALAAEPPDPCSLLTTSQMESAFGKLKGAPRSNVGLQKEKECHYENVEGNSVVMRIYSADRWAAQKGINSETQALPNLGEEAFMVKKGTDKEIYMRKKSWILEIDGSADSEKLKSVAALAVARLP